MEKKELIESVFKEIEEAINKTLSPKPVQIKDSELIKELKKIKQKYLK